MKYTTTFAAGLVFAVAGCNPGQEGAPMPTVDGHDAMVHVRELVGLGPRVSGTPGAERAAGHLEAAAQKLDWQVTVDEWSEQTDHGEVTFRNVHAVLPGRGKDFVLLASHYDTKYLPDIPDFQGANDSGSSTGLLLALMKVLAENPPRQTVECVFFDGEESRRQYTSGDGLHGSRRFVRRLTRENRLVHCRAMILMDMIGDRDLQVNFPPSSSDTLVRQAFDIAERQGVRDAFGYRTKGDILDDHTPFAKKGVRCINFIDFNFGPENAYWHTRHDTLEKLDPQSLQTVGNVVLEMVYELAGKPEPGNVRHDAGDQRRAGR